MKIIVIALVIFFANIQASPAEDINHTIEEMINDNLTRPSWESLEASDGNSYVNIKGIMPKLDNALVTIQYRVYPEQKSAQFQALEMNGNKVDGFFALAYIGSMCKD